jgi:cell division protein FtsB
MRRYLPLLTNKYLIALVAFLVILLFTDRNDVFMQMERRAELRGLEDKKRFYQQEIEATQKQLYELQHNSEALETYAREQLLMKRENEDLFIVEPAAEAEALNRAGKP